MSRSESFISCKFPRCVLLKEKSRSQSSTVFVIAFHSLCHAVLYSSVTGDEARSFYSVNSKVSPGDKFTLKI